MKIITNIIPSKEYRKKIAKEQSFYDTSFIAWVKGKDSWYQGHYLLYMRYAEYYNHCNNSIMAKALGGGKSSDNEWFIVEIGLSNRIKYLGIWS